MAAYCKANYVLSMSKLVLFALIPALLEYTSEAILVATTNTNYECIHTIVVDKTHKHDYPVLYAENETSIDEFMTNMTSKGIRVGIIHTSHHLFYEMLRCGNGAIWYSACRDGIFKYLKEINKYATKPTTVLCFDNDEAMVERAKTMYAKTNITVHKCVAHSVCSTIKFDALHGQVNLTGGKDCYLFFPPEAHVLHANLYNPREAMSKRVQLRFSESKEAFTFYTVAKMIDVNAIHTMVCVMAYVEGAKKGITMECISDMRFSLLLGKSDTLKTISQIHSLLFNRHLSATAMQLNEKMETHTRIVCDFIEYLFSSAEEVVGRGLDYRHDSYITKMTRHFPLLRSIDDAYVNETLDTFIHLF